MNNISVSSTTANASRSSHMSYQKVLSGRRISLPDDLSKKYGIKEGDLVIIESDKDGIRIIPAEIIKKRPM